MGCTLVRFSAVIAVSILFSAVALSAQNRVVQGEYIVKMKPQVGQQANSRLSKGIGLVKKMGSAVAVKQAFWGSTMLHIKSDSAASIESLRADPDVEYIEPNYILSLDPTTVESMGVPAGATDDYSQSNANVQVTEAWGIAKPSGQGSKTVVAVIDTGLDTEHGLFKDANAVWLNAAEKNGLPGIDDDGNGYIDDVNGWNYVANNGNVFDDDDHGTHVAGIVLGVGQDILAYPVRESKIKIMALKFLDANGSGSTANAISAIYYAVNMGAKVINNSWGGPSYSRSLHDAYTYAHTNSVVIVTAAGNSGANNDTTPSYPAALDTPNNIAVAASTDADSKASFSNFGLSVHVAAPGVAITSSVPGGGCIAPGCYARISGTSMASPFVAGLAALLIREAPQLSGYQIRTILLSGINTFASLNSKVSTSGRVNALKATQDAIAKVGAVSFNPSYSPVYKTDRAVASAAPADGAGGAGCGLVKALGTSGSAYFGKGSDGGSGGGGFGNMAVVLVLVLVPVLFAIGFRKKVPAEAQGIKRRQYARYNVAKDVVLKIGDQVISTASESLSMGGLSFTGAVAITKGEKVKVLIDGLEQEMDGEVVWCSSNQSYGVKFLNLTEQVTEQLKANFSMWTSGLTPT